VLDFAPGDGWPDVILFVGENENSRNFAKNSDQIFAKIAGENDQKTALKIAKIISPKSGKEIKFADFLRGLK
jgi:hypothetical protein